MSRKPVQEWMILLTYLFVLILITVHSGYLCQKLWFVLKQFFPVIAAGILAFVLNRPYKYVQCFYEKKIRLPEKMSRIGGLLTVYLGLLGAAAAAGRYALPRFIDGLRQFMENREKYMMAFEDSARLVFQKAGIQNLDFSPLMEGISNYLSQLDQVMNNLLPQMARLTTGAFRGLALFGIIIVLSVYILYDKEGLKSQAKRFYNVYMPKSYAQPVRRFIYTALNVFDNFVAGQGLESIILGVLCFLGMFFLKLEYSGFVSIVVGLTAFIPFFGAYIGGGLGTILLLFISVRKAVVFLTFFVILQQIENNFIYPRVVGKRTGLPGLWVLAAVSVGGGLLGIVGMILSVPVVTLIYVMLQRNLEQHEECVLRHSEENYRQEDKNRV